MKLSVALCTYNGEKYIQKQLESILNQSMEVDEIVICDDGSNDKTIAILEQFQLKKPGKIFLYKNQINLGSTKNFEKAITICTGDYIFLSDQDDIWKENKVEKIIQYFSANPSLEGVFTNGDIINENETIYNHTLWDAVFFIENQLEKPIDLFKLMSSKRNMVTGATLCFKKEAKDFILPFPELKKYHHDEWIALNIGFRNKLNYIPENLISYRIHSEQQIGGKKNIKKNLTQRHINLSNYILEKQQPTTYKDINQLTKTYFRNYLKFRVFAKNAKRNCPINFEEISQNNLALYKKWSAIQKKCNPLFYFFKIISDRIRGKRQLK
ncbi:glycosyltransferase family 2 protein [Flavobacterium adhaerens]|uniref:glycosyltransferase family 2 protein n=1 Tax=Flavobacterium adhaerens TaxID=3149043 RepID=UPI0032B43B7B